MAVARAPAQAGFTLIELMIAVAIIGLLAAIALGQWRDYTRRARMSEAVLAATTCKTRVSESYLSLPEPPASAGAWGCSGGSSHFVSEVQTSPRGVIRVTVANLDPAVNGLHLHLVPMRADGSAALDPAADLGNAVGQWLCGSDAEQVRNALPANCRQDTSTFAAETFE
ncbi:pilin [Ramlibacter sp. USB13]|uniref:Pilin n=1 Tax=Ramlibacter cellulosilyticus TaxID=2764187 RepID=A0A923MRX9_9BURK|nr:pilin [Ramlibacter cellulosilyticus]MBC5782722.1 pilin [Ramlibacter cellulosilyticus]